MDTITNERLAQKQSKSVEYKKWIKARAKVRKKKELKEKLKIKRTWVKLHKLYYQRSLDLLPQSNSYSKYISLDNNGLYNIFKRVGVKLKKSVTLEEKDQLWEDYFNINKIVSKNRKLGYLIKTNGYGVSVSISNLRPTRNIANEYGFSFEDEDSFNEAVDESELNSQDGPRKKKRMFRPLDMNSKIRIVGIDPGANTIAQCTFGILKGQTISFTRKCWHYRSGMARSKRARKKRFED